MTNMTNIIKSMQKETKLIMQKATTNDFKKLAHNGIYPYDINYKEMIRICMKLGISFAEICKDNDVKKFKSFELFQIMLMLQIYKMSQKTDLDYVMVKENFFTVEQYNRDLLGTHKYSHLDGNCFERGDFFLERPPAFSGFDFILTDGFGRRHNIQLTEKMLQDTKDENTDTAENWLHDKIQKQPENVKIFISSITPTILKDKIQEMYKNNKNVYIFDTHHFNVSSRVINDNNGNEMYLHEAFSGNH